MSDYTQVLIGIQARSTSTRFPRKVFELIGEKPIIKHVTHASTKCAQYLNEYSHKNRLRVEIAVLVPYGDELCSFLKQSPVSVLQGPEHDVLTRYKMALDQYQADYIVRITADCPLIPAFLISKLITTAVVNGYDYYSNVDERVRTTCDGMDVEVISAHMLNYLNETAKDPYDREHVTPLARRSPFLGARLGHVVGFLDLSQLKLSVDTPEDLEAVRDQYQKIKASLEKAQELYGKSHTHRI